MILMLAHVGVAILCCFVGLVLLGTLYTLMVTTAEQLQESYPFFDSYPWTAHVLAGLLIFIVIFGVWGAIYTNLHW